MIYYTDDNLKNFSNAKSRNSSGSSNSVTRVPPKFLLREYGIRYIPDPKGHYSMENNNSYIAGVMGHSSTPVESHHTEQPQQASDSNASDKAVFKSKPSDKKAKTVRRVADRSEKTKVRAKAVSIRNLSEERWKEGILSRIIQLAQRLGGLAPGLLDMFCAGLEPAEIEAVRNELEWLYGPNWGAQGPVNVETYEQAYEASLVAQEQVMA
jgi:hypothetical protein